MKGILAQEFVVWEFEIEGGLIFQIYGNEFD
jgi:hypothetical protein